MDAVDRLAQRRRQPLAGGGQCRLAGGEPRRNLVSTSPSSLTSDQAAAQVELLTAAQRSSSRAKSVASFNAERPAQRDRSSSAPSAAANSRNGSARVSSQFADRRGQRTRASWDSASLEPSRADVRALPTGTRAAARRSRRRCRPASRKCGRPSQAAGSRCRWSRRNGPSGGGVGAGGNVPAVSGSNAVDIAVARGVERQPLSVRGSNGSLQAAWLAVWRCSVMRGVLAGDDEVPQ